MQMCSAVIQHTELYNFHLLELLLTKLQVVSIRLQVTLYYLVLFGIILYYVILFRVTCNYLELFDIT